MKLQLFFTINWASKFNRAIALYEAGIAKYAKARSGGLFIAVHTGAIYTYDESDQVAWNIPASRREYFESIIAVDEQTGKTGPRGPYPFERLSAWQAVDPKNRRLEVLDVPGLTPDELIASRQRALWAVRNIGYARYQLVQNLLGVKLKIGPLRFTRSRGLWTCVEYAMQLLPARLAKSDFGLGYVLFDEYCPWGSDSYGLYQLLNSYNARQGIERPQSVAKKEDNAVKEDGR